MNQELVRKFRAYQAKEETFRKARQDRDFAKTQLTMAIRVVMQSNGLRRGDIFKRLRGWTYEKIGNVLHLHQGLKSEAEWIELINAVSEPKNKK
jgi:hypothetical protein